MKLSTMFIAAAIMLVLCVVIVVVGTFNAKASSSSDESLRRSFILGVNVGRLVCAHTLVEGRDWTEMSAEAFTDTAFVYLNRYAGAPGEAFAVHELRATARRMKSDAAK